MSSKRKPTKLRGPSRPIDPRNAPGYKPVRSGPDTFGIVMLGVSAAFVVLVILFVVLQNNSSTSTNTASTGQDTSANTAPQNLDDPGAQATATIVAFLNIVADVPRLSIQEVKALQDANNVTIIDVMTPDHYANSHVKGAINIPQADIVNRAAEIPKTGNVVIYCECPNDEESLGSTKSLMRGLGYTNLKVMQGPRALTLWKQAGYPTEGSGS
ncbi:MAG: rhodanese-like domain-containing protein [Chloroflexota bacterium]|nr:rhodanese-like domain-containing protein [Chloroflexota bacterium]